MAPRMARNHAVYERNARRRSVLAYRSSSSATSDIAAALKSDSVTTRPRRSALKTTYAPRFSQLKFDRRPSAESNFSTSTQGGQWRTVRFQQGTRPTDGDDVDTSPTAALTKFRLSRKLARLRSSFEYRGAQQLEARLRASARASYLSAKRDSRIQARASITSLASDLEDAFNQIAKELAQQIRTDSVIAQDGESEEWSIHSASSSLSETPASPEYDTYSASEGGKQGQRLSESSASSSTAVTSVLQPLAWNFPSHGPPTVKPLALTAHPTQVGPVKIGDIKRQIRTDDSDTQVELKAPRLERLNSDPNITTKASQPTTFFGRARANSIGAMQFGSIAPRRSRTLESMSVSSTGATCDRNDRSSRSSSESSRSRAGATLKPLLLESKASLHRQLSQRSLRNLVEFTKRGSRLLPVSTSSKLAPAPSSEQKRTDSKPLPLTPRLGDFDDAQDHSDQECLATPSPFAESFTQLPWNRTRQHSQSNIAESRRPSQASSDSEGVTDSQCRRPSQESGTSDSVTDSHQSGSQVVKTKSSATIAWRYRDTLILSKAFEHESEPPTVDTPLGLEQDPFARSDGVQVVPTPEDATDHIAPRRLERKPSQAMSNPLLASLLEAEARESKVSVDGWISGIEKTTQVARLPDSNQVQRSIRFDNGVSHFQDRGLGQAYPLYSRPGQADGRDVQGLCNDSRVTFRPQQGFADGPAPKDRFHHRPSFSNSGQLHLLGTSDSLRRPSNTSAASRSRLRKIACRTKEAFDRARALSLPVNEKQITAPVQRHERQNSEPTFKATQASTTHNAFAGHPNQGGEPRPGYVQRPDFGFGSRQAVPPVDSFKSNMQPTQQLPDWVEEQLRHAFADTPFDRPQYQIPGSTQPLVIKYGGLRHQPSEPSLGQVYSSTGASSSQRFNSMDELRQGSAPKRSLSSDTRPTQTLPPIAGFYTRLPPPEHRRPSAASSVGSQSQQIYLNQALTASMESLHDPHRFRAVHTVKDQTDTFDVLTRKTKPHRPRPRNPPKLVRATAGAIAGAANQLCSKVTAGSGSGPSTVPKTRQEREEEGMLTTAMAREHEGLAVNAGAGMASVVYC